MGWTVLYLAFGLVALWLLGEVLLQYKARLRWRLLAFFGFLGVVLGVVLPSVLVIAVGAGAFAVGQTLVTLSFRKGFSTGWALGGKPGTSRRRREIRPMAPLEDGEGHDAHAGPEGYAADDYRRDEYGAERHAGDGYDGDGYGGEEYGREEYGRDGYGREEHGRDGYRPETAPPSPPPAPAAAPRRESPDIYAAYAQAPAPDYATTSGYGEYGGYPGADLPREEPAAAPYAAAYSQDAATGSGYPAYSDPYIGGGYQDYGAADGGYLSPSPQPPGAGAYGGYDAPAAGSWPAPDPYYQETPPGGVWMPQQRDPVLPDSGYPQPQPQPYGAPAQPDPGGYYYDGRGY